MTKQEAHDIINGILDLGYDNTSKRYRNFVDSGYPELGQIFLEYTNSDMTPREFYKRAEEALIVGNSKLGKALK